MNQINPSPASSLTRIASKQTYYTIRFLVDGERVDDAYRSYAYFRWVDDNLDADSGSDAIHLARGGLHVPVVEKTAPARLEPAMAPPGQDTLTAIIMAGCLSENRKQDWDELRDEPRGHVFRRLRTLGMSDIEAHIKFEQTYTPLSWAERYNLMNGSTHGLFHTLTQMACFRPSNRHPRYQNLCFVGASTHPGTGNAHCHGFGPPGSQADYG